MLRRDFMKGVAFVALASSVAVPTVAEPVPREAQENLPLQWQGHGPQALQDVLNGNVALEHVYLIRLSEEDYDKVRRDIGLYAENGMMDEYRRRAKLFCQIPVDWLVEGEPPAIATWKKLEGPMPLARNRGRFKYFWHEPFHG